LIQYKEVINIQDLNQKEIRKNNLIQTVRKLNEKNSQYYILYFDDPDPIYNERLSRLKDENKIEDDVIPKIYEIRKQILEIKNAIDQQQI
jgi:hypothetical protein